jgi:hypothetical protein
VLPDFAGNGRGGYIQRKTCGDQAADRRASQEVEPFADTAVVLRLDLRQKCCDIQAAKTAAA